MKHVVKKMVNELLKNVFTTVVNKAGENCEHICEQKMVLIAGDNVGEKCWWIV